MFSIKLQNLSFFFRQNQRRCNTATNESSGNVLPTSFYAPESSPMYPAPNAHKLHCGVVPRVQLQMTCYSIIAVWCGATDSGDSGKSMTTRCRFRKVERELSGFSVSMLGQSVCPTRQHDSIALLLSLGNGYIKLCSKDIFLPKMIRQTRPG
jgi:hypothetical protein